MLVSADIGASEMSLRQHQSIGLIGGLSWQSTALYYRLINQSMETALGGHNNAESIVVTVNFETLLAAGGAGDWARVGDILVDAARTLERAGAGCVLLTANTAHKVAADVAAAIDCPLIHIAKVTAAAVADEGVRRVGVLGTKPTLESGLYHEYLDRHHGIEVLTPSLEDQDAIHRIIVDELTMGKATSAARDRCLAVVSGFAEAGAEAVVIGCTELPLLFDEILCSIPVFDTTRLHAEAAVRFALSPPTQD